MIVFPNAKINIGLHIVSKRDDGYHNLESIFYPVKLADALEIVDSHKTDFSFSGLKINCTLENNLIYKAYLLLKNDFKIPELKLHLHKVIPYEAGLGGGSADAAFTLKLLNDYFKLGLKNEKLERYATKIGADCPFFIENKPAFAEGIGDRLNPVNLDLSEFKILIIKPPVSVSTSVAYNNIKPKKSKFNLRKLAEIPIEQWKEYVVNDFEKAVFPKYPQVRNLKEILYEMGALYASMSGSGSAVYGIFRHLPTNIDKKIPNGVFIYR